MTPEEAQARAASEIEAVHLGIALADGSEYSLEIPFDHPALPSLLVDRDVGDSPIADVHQLPMSDGNSVLTFSSRHLVRLEVRGGEQTLARLRAVAGGAAVEQPASRRAGQVDSTGNGLDPSTNLEEGHLGGFLRASTEPIPNSATSEHGDRATWYPSLWRWLVEDLGIRSMLDIGCGEGHAAGFFRDAGCRVLGVDGSLLARKESVIAGSHVVHDYVDGPFVPQGEYDLAWSCEFVEHVEERFVPNFLATFAASRKYVLMTFAPPGMPGWHHVNCQPQSYWVEKFGRLGFDLDRQVTEQARTTAGHGHFGHRGLVLVRRTAR